MKDRAPYSDNPDLLETSPRFHRIAMAMTLTAVNVETGPVRARQATFNRRELVIFAPRKKAGLYRSHCPSALQPEGIRRYRRRAMLHITFIWPFADLEKSCRIDGSSMAPKSRSDSVSQTDFPIRSLRSNRPTTEPNIPSEG
jgi:hypothetical protein